MKNEQKIYRKNPYKPLLSLGFDRKHFQETGNKIYFFSDKKRLTKLVGKVSQFLTDMNHPPQVANISKIKKFHCNRLNNENKSFIDGLLLVAGVMDNIDLSKINASDTPNRYPLAFFVSKFWLTSQVTQSHDTHLTPFTGVNRHKFMADLPAVYDWVTLQNKPIRRICRAVTCVTESEPNHPMIIHSVVNTQNITQGGHNHA